MGQLILRITDDLHDQLRHAKIVHQRFQEDIVMEAIEEWLERRK